MISYNVTHYAIYIIWYYYKTDTWILDIHKILWNMISVVSYKTISFLLIKLNHIAYNIFIYCMIVRELWRFIPPWKCQFSDIKGFKTIFNRIIFKFTWYAHPLDFSSAWNKISIHIHPAICNMQYCKNCVNQFCGISQKRYTCPC